MSKYTQVKKQIMSFIGRQWIMFEILSQGFWPLENQAPQLVIGNFLGSLLEMFLQFNANISDNFNNSFFLSNTFTWPAPLRRLLQY